MSPPQGLELDKNKTKTYSKKSKIRGGGIFVFQEQNMGLYLSLKNPINALITIQYIILISLKLQRKREIFSDLSNKQLFLLDIK